MKAAVIWSSPNKDGLTAAVKNQFIKGLAKTETQADEIHINSMRLEHCRACADGWGSCRSRGECILQDDFQEIYRKLVEADGIVLISAVYWSDMTECMKALIDRLRRCEAVHNHYLKDKRCILAACAGGTGRGTLECLQNMELALTHMGMRAYDRIPVNRYNQDYMLPALETAGSVYADRLKNGFDMFY